jgi:hypothetical protein
LRFINCNQIEGLTTKAVTLRQSNARSQMLATITTCKFHS